MHAAKISSTTRITAKACMPSRVGVIVGLQHVRISTYVLPARK
jgi:hypothetical protein